MKKVVVVGGGIAGLSFAYEALLHQYAVLLLEKENVLGGLSKSITHNNCRLDMGVHLMHLRDKQVFEKIQEIVDPQQWITIKRNGKLYLKKRYIEWPLTVKSLFQLPLFFGGNILFDQLTKKKIKNKTSNFHDELLSLYGPTLYYSFFQPLSEKFLKISSHTIHPDWAFSSLRAATKVEDESFSKSYKYLVNNTDDEAKKDFKIIPFLLNMLKPKEESFYYFKDGFGVLPESYEKKIREMHGVIASNSEIQSLVIEGNTIKQCIINGKKHDVDYFVWTGHLFTLCNLLNIEFPSLTYLHSKFIYVFLRKSRLNHQVCYYADVDISFPRATIFSNHSKTIIHNPSVEDVLCVEYTFKTEKELSVSFKDLKPKLVADLKKVNLINDEEDIESFFEINSLYSYPIFTVDYQEKISTINAALQKLNNLITLGRQGTFNYDNADIIIKEVINHSFFQREKKD
jgi:protoporphyrinogen oxidase